MSLLLAKEVNIVKESNELFPVFLKLGNFHTLLVGAGNVGLEKISAMLNNSPNARISVVASEVSRDFAAFAASFDHISVYERPFEEGDLEGISLVVLATDQFPLHQYIYELCKEKGILLNVADTPDLCDMYLGSIVKKGNLKIAISTNGKSPTMAKRLKEVLNESLPAEIDGALDTLSALRNRLEGDFSYKVKRMNEYTAELVRPGNRVSVARGTWRLLIAALIVLLLLNVGMIIF